jgi:hypothetical protein
MNKVQRKWWFAIPVICLAFGCTLWLCRALGFADPLMPFSLPRLIVFLISLNAFQRLYSWALWWALVWLASSRVGEKPLRT